MDAAKKQAILEAATKAFAQHGYKKTSIDDVAKAAGVAKGTVYLACTSKEDLFYQVLHREVRAWVGEISKLIDPRVPADQLLASMSHVGLAYIDAHPLVRDLLFGKTMELLPKWSDRFQELRAIGNANVVEVLKLGVKQGVFRDGMDLEAVAALLQDLQLAGLVFYAFGKGGPIGVERRVVAGFDLVLNGLRAAGARG
jgi:AcrR family transcriptional regulator